MSVVNGSPMKHVEVSDGSLLRHVGLRWGMSVSNGSPMGDVGIRWVSDMSQIGLR